MFFSFYNARFYAYIVYIEVRYSILLGTAVPSYTKMRDSISIGSWHVAHVIFA